MDLFDFLKRVTAVSGLPGREGPVAETIADAFRSLADEVRIDGLYNVASRVGEEGPRIMVTAHQDEIGLVVTDIESDGSLRFTRSGGVDPRILPALPVTVHTREGALHGVVGAKPPHLLSAEDQKKAVKMEDLYIDIGFDAETVRKKVRVGDAVTMCGETIELADGRMAGKTMDDRACVAAMLEAAEWLKKMNAPARVAFVAASQEEVGGRGACVATYDFEPDVAIVIDVTHGVTPGADQWQTHPMDKPTLTVGPLLHPALNALIQQTAKRNHVEICVSAGGGHTSTDADTTQISRSGVPTVLIGLPLKYMHTTVEMLDGEVVREIGRLVAHFIDDLARGWEEIKWF